MIGRMLSVGIFSNPIIVEWSDEMSQYLNERYLDMFVKYTGNTKDGYTKGYIYKVSQKQDGTDTVYFFAPYFYLEALDNPADSLKVLDGYQAYNDKGEKLEGQYKTSEKVVTGNGTFYPADDNVNAYSKVTVNVESGSAQNPYVATTDTEMSAYLAAEYKDSFVRMDYAKYRMTLPATATTTTAIFTCENIGISRVCSYIDKWLGADRKKTILELKATSGTVTFLYTTIAYKVFNADKTCGYAIAITLTTSSDGNSDSNSTPLFLYNIKNGTEIDGYTADQDWYVGWTNFGGDTESSTIKAVNELITATLTNLSGTYTVAVGNAFVLTNMAGSEADNKYVEGAVYKVSAKYTELNTYVAESPFEVGDQLAGATVYLNQQITSDEFEAMCAELAEKTDFGILDGTFVFVNVDYPIAEPTDDTAIKALYAPMALLTASWNDGIGQLRSMSVDTANTVILGTNSTSSGNVPVSPATPSSFTVATTVEAGSDVGTLTIPATITKINFPTLLNAVAGKTANFTKQSTIETSYVFDLQLSNGAFEEAQSETKLDAKATNDNIGKVYQYTGATGTKYTNQSLYIIMED